MLKGRGNAESLPKRFEPYTCEWGVERNNSQEDAQNLP